MYTPKPKEKGYPAETRLLAIRMYVEGSSYGSIGRVLKVNPQSVPIGSVPIPLNSPKHQYLRK
ncbi:MAG: hypothetical protein U0V02_07835 [Anaerolineales bacterium]